MMDESGNEILPVEIKADQTMVNGERRVEMKKIIKR
jgi:hypothetical protein